MDKRRISIERIKIKTIDNDNDIHDNDDDDDDNNNYHVRNYINVPEDDDFPIDNDHTSSSSSSPTSIKIDASLCFRIHKYLNQNWCLNYVLPIIIIVTILILLYFGRDYAKALLFWIENQNPWLIFTVFMFMFVIVSFPVMIGYLILMITSGYLFGCIKGFLIVILGANIGVTIAHNTIRSIHKRYPIQKLIKNETAKAILRVISGHRAFKIVMFTRLTPIPFGLQNTIFAVSSVDARSYHFGTLIGLLPAQTINVYLGSTLRSMQDVLNHHDTAVTGYIVFIIQVLIGLGLMVWVIQKAKAELSEALLSHIGTEHKDIIIQM